MIQPYTVHYGFNEYQANRKKQKNLTAIYSDLNIILGLYMHVFNSYYVTWWMKEEQLTLYASLFNTTLNPVTSISLLYKLLYLFIWIPIINTTINSFVNRYLLQNLWKMNH